MNPRAYFDSLQELCWEGGDKLFIVISESIPHNRYFQLLFVLKNTFQFSGIFSFLRHIESMIWVQKLIIVSFRFFQIFNRDEPDREKLVHVTVKASDNGRPQLEDVCTLAVKINDINDNSPVFDRANYGVPIAQVNLRPSLYREYYHLDKFDVMVSCRFG